MVQTLVQPIDQLGFESLAALCKAAADPLRLSILRVLRGESYGVQELTFIFDMIQSRMSHHLKVLANAELVATRKEGTFVFYRRPLLTDDDPHYALKRGLWEAIDARIIPEDAAARIATIRQDRDQASKQFFEKNAARFQEKQDMIVTYDQYSVGLDELLATLSFPPQARVLEVGPGQGDLLCRLAQRFQDVHALDRSVEMLAQTREAIGDEIAVTYHHGSLEEAHMQGLQTDLLVLNMVLHHMASPAEAFTHCAQILRPGGTLLIADLNAHGQSWVTEACGDLWQGFEPEQLTQWADQAGLREGARMFLGLKNGFRVQMRLFHQFLETA